MVDPEANRHCAEFELWLGEEAHRAVLTSFQRKQPAARAAAGTRHSNLRYIVMVLSFVVGFPIYVAKDILQPSSIYPTIERAHKVAEVRRFTPVEAQLLVDCTKECRWEEQEFSLLSVQNHGRSF